MPPDSQWPAGRLPKDQAGPGLPRGTLRQCQLTSLALVLVPCRTATASAWRCLQPGRRRAPAGAAGTCLHCRDEDSPALPWPQPKVPLAARPPIIPCINRTAPCRTIPLTDGPQRLLAPTGALWLGQLPERRLHLHRQLQALRPRQRHAAEQPAGAVSAVVEAAAPFS